MLGIDVSKDQLTCALLDPHSKRLLWETTVPNSPAGVTQLLKRSPASSAWVLEPTGRYSATVARQARAAGRQVLLAVPRKAHHFLQSLPQRAKTDRLDSRGLGLYALSVSLSHYPLPTPAVEHLQQLLTVRKTLAQDLARYQQQCQELPLGTQLLAPVITATQAQIKELDRQIAAAQAEFPLMLRLRQVHGIGPVTAAQVAARLAASDFAHPDQFVSFIGLDIRVRQSGKRQGHQGLTKHGDAELRRLFYLCAQASLRAKESPFLAQYEREKKKGLSKTAALCAVARKMARLCWSLAKYGSEYDPDRVYAQPIAPCSDVSCNNSNNQPA
jgi:transposase